MDIQSLEANIYKLFVIKVAKWLMLYMPILWLFYAENGLTLTDLFIIQSIYSVAIACIEIPSGYVADVLGRRKALIIGTFFGLIGMIVYSLSYSFMGFLSAALCLGIGQSFISGSDTAIMYDTLVTLKRSDEFIKIEGKTISLGNVAEASAFIIGGLLAEISLRTPFYAQVILALIGFIAALSLVEPIVARLTKSNNSIRKNIKHIIHYSMIENHRLRNYLLYSAIIGAATLVMAWFTQPYFLSIGITSTFNFGLIGAVLNIAVAIPSFYAHQIEKNIDTTYLLIIILVVICSGYFFVGYLTTLWGLLALFLFNIMRGVATPVLRDYMNREIPSSMRATVMSIRSFVTRTIFASTAPLFGFVADVYSLQQSIFLGGLIFFIIGSISLFFLIKK